MKTKTTPRTYTILDAIEFAGHHFAIEHSTAGNFEPEAFTVIHRFPADVTRSTGSSVIAFETRTAAEQHLLRDAAEWGRRLAARPALSLAA